MCNNTAMGRDLSLKEYPQNYVVLDIETTGFSAIKNEIIELCAIKVQNGQITDKFSQLIKPVGFLSPYISNLTGITQEMLANAPFIDEVIPKFNQFCAGNIVIGHNITFDLKFIATKLFQCNNLHFNNDYIDTLKLARVFLAALPSKKLGILAQYFGINTEGMHRGLKDCEVTNICYQKFMEYAKTSGRNFVIRN